MQLVIVINLLKYKNQKVIETYFCDVMSGDNKEKKMARHKKGRFKGPYYLV